MNFKLILIISLLVAVTIYTITYIVTKEADLPQLPAVQPEKAAPSQPAEIPTPSDSKE